MKQLKATFELVVCLNLYYVDITAQRLQSATQPR